MAARESVFFNRELSWLEFNQRVLDEAKDPDVPALQRLNFLGITASNLDEFFMVRVGRLELLAAARIVKKDPSGKTPAQQIEAVGRRGRQMVEAQYALYCGVLEPLLREAGIRRVRPGEITDEQMAHLHRVTEEEIVPVVTPMAVAAAAEFPTLPGLRMHLAARLKPAEGDDSPRFAVIPMGPRLPRMIPVPAAVGHAYVLIEDLIVMSADRLFPGEPVAEITPFRITRNADMAVREDVAPDMLIGMQEVLDARKESDCVRLEVQDSASRVMIGFLQKSLKVKDANLYPLPGPMELAALARLASIEGFDALRYPAWPPQASPDLDPKRSIFEELSAKSVVLCHPYDQFDPVVRLVEEAARDPDVLAIKQTLYRTGSDSPVVRALRQAAERGKYVTALIELKARFDEAQNIEWAKEMERSGVQVIYGVKGLKTHCKVLIVVRREPRGVVRYVHFGTGNYNDRTARLYSDVSYMTKDENLGADATAFFNAISGYSEPHNLSKLVMAPTGLREKLMDLIEKEAEHKRAGRKALIQAKMNSLSDPGLIKALYKASQAGVPIHLNVRGVCCLRPGVPDLSETISVTSIVDRFLEHSRIFFFHHGGEQKLFISSADWMPRNLDKRVELMVPVEDAACRRRVLSWLETYFQDTVKSRALQRDGRYKRVVPAERRKPLRSQEELYRRACAAVKEAAQAKPTVFEPHRPPGAEP